MLVVPLAPWLHPVLNRRCAQILTHVSKARRGCTRHFSGWALARYSNVS